MGERPYCSSSVGAANGRPFLNRRCSSCFLTATQIGDSTLGAAQGELPAGQERVPWGITVPHESLARYYRQHLRIQFADIDLHFTVGRGALTPPNITTCRWFTRRGEGTPPYGNIYRYILPVGTVRNNVQKVCATLLSPRGPSLALRAIHLVSRLLGVAGLCSSNPSGNCKYFTKQTQE